MADQDTDAQRREKQQQEQQKPGGKPVSEGETGAGEAPGAYDQYAVNQPQTMPRDTNTEEARRRQARAQADHDDPPQPGEGAEEDAGDGE